MSGLAILASAGVALGLVSLVVFRASRGWRARDLLIVASLGVLTVTVSTDPPWLGLLSGTLGALVGSWFLTRAAEMYDSYRGARGRQVFDRSVIRGQGERDEPGLGLAMSITVAAILLPSAVILGSAVISDAVRAVLILLVAFTAWISYERLNHAEQP